MTKGTGGRYSESITIPSGSTDTLYYYFEADDIANTTRDPSSGDRSVIVTDDDDPVIGSDSSDISAGTGNSFSFGISVSDNVDSSPSVSVEYWFGSGSHTTSAMTGTGPYTYQITIPSDSTSSLHYIFHASDDASNSASTTQVDIAVADDDDPVFGTDTSDTSASTGDAFDFGIVVTDNVDTSPAVNVEYWFGTGSHTTTAMSGTGPYTYQIAVPSDSTSTLHYIFHAADNAANSVSTTRVDVTVADNDDPLFGTDSSDPSATTGEPFDFAIAVNDAVDPTPSVSVEYWFGTGSHTTSAMSGTGPYTYQITVPSDSISILHYIFHAADDASNSASTTQVDVTVSDNDDPVFGTDSSDASAKTGDPFNFGISVSDSVDSSPAVSVEYWFGTGSHTTSAMSGTGPYTYQITVPSDSISALHYIFHAVDDASNSASTTQVDVSVSDNDNPTFRNNKTNPSTLTTGDSVSVSVEIEDNIEVSSATLYYDFGIGEGYLSSSTYTISATTYTWSLTVPKNSTTIDYYFTAADSSSNLGRSGDYGPVVVLDNDLPVFNKNLLNPSVPTTGDTLFITVEISDNIGVSSAILHYDFGLGEVTSAVYTRIGSVYNWTLMIPHNATLMYYRFSARDHASNLGESPTWGPVTVTDNDLPTFSNNVVTPSNLRTGDTFSISVDISDNIKVTGATLYYDFGSGYISSTTYTINETIYEWDSLTVDPSATSMDYYVTAVDRASNLGTSPVWTKAIADDDPPAFTNIKLNPAEPTTGDILNISADIRDNIKVISATLHYKFGNGYSKIKTNMSVGFVYKWSIEVPVDATSFTYYFSADDGSLGGESIDRTVDVADNDDPVFFDCMITPSIIETGEDLTISIEITDNIRVDNTVLNYDFGSGYKTSTSYKISGSKYTWNLEIPIDSMSFSYYFTAEDLQGNMNQTDVCSVGVKDIIKPTYADNSKSSGSTGDQYFLDIEASDNIGIKWVNITWSHGELGSENIGLDDDGDGTWSMKIAADDSTDALTYTVTFTDTSGNSIKSAIRSVTIIDNDYPTFTDGSSEEGYSGSDYVVEVEASDNIGIDKIYLTWSHGSLGGSDQVMTALGEGIWRITIQLDDSREKLSYSVSVLDLSGNILNGTENVITVTDNEQPSIKDLDDATIYSGSRFSLSVEAEDNVGIKEIKWSGLPKTFYGSTIRGYVNQSGTYTVVISVTDTSGNSNQITITVEVLPKNNDIDKDGIPDLVEEIYGLNSYDPSDATEDMDRDDLSNLDEYRNGTLMNVSDTDGDGMPDGWEVLYGLDPLQDNSEEDSDGDGVTDLQEYLDGTDPSVDETNELLTYIVWLIIIVILIFAFIGALTIFLIIRKGKRPIQLLKAELTEGPKEVFISYAHDDQNVAYSICNKMEEKGLHCWIAPRDVTPGMNWGKAIIEAINTSKVMILVFSAKSNESEQVLREVERAVNKKVPIIMYRITDIMPSQELEYFISAVHWLDAFSEPMEEHLDNLANTVESTLHPEKNKEAEKLKEGQQRQLLNP
ncbi:MAG: TIR domain-containing protein [Thermoplasmatota archaeon]